MEPASVIWLAPARAMPKSVTLTRRSSSIITLCGLMSRWTIPFSCAWPSAASTWRATSTAMCTGAGPRAAIELLQVPALQVLHRDVVGALGLAAVEDRDDVRVREPGGVLRLAAEALDELLVVRVPLVEDLDRDAPPERLVLGEVDGRHAAGAELAHDLVPPVEEGVDQGV